MNKILLINDSENAEELAMILGFDLGIKNHRVRAIFPVLDYALRVVKKNPTEFKFIIIEPHNEMLSKKFVLVHELSREFPNIQIITIGKPKFSRSDMPNIYSFEDIEKAALHIKEVFDE
jgi:hypothetical protein